MNHRTVTYCLMGVLVTLWGIEYVAAKYMLGFVEPMTLQFMKSAMGTLFLLPVILRQTQQPHQIPRLSPAARLKDAGMVVLATGIGIVLYFLCEYTAMDYLPVSAITLMLGILPAMSIIVERIVYGRKISAKLLLLVFASIAGIAIVIGGDFRVLLSGRLIGYVLSFGCVMCWTVYNFITEHMGAGSTPYTLAFRQLLYTSVMLLPYFILHFPEFGSFTLTANIAMLFLGIVISGCGYIIIVRTLTELGPSIEAMFVNLMPVSTTIFGWLLLGEMISPVQILGGVIIIVAGFLAIREKARLQKSIQFK